MIAVAYIRTEDGEDVLQRTKIESWAARRCVEVAAWRTDVRLGGATPIAERPGLLAAFEAIRAHGAGVLVAANASRFACDDLVAWLIERAALVEGATLETADGSRWSTPSAAPQAYTRGTVDLARAYDRVMARARIRATQSAKRARGERIGNVPFGFRLAEDGVHVEPDAAEQAVIATVHRLSSDGLSQRAIVGQLAALGVHGRTGAALGQTQVAKILRAGRDR